jgi:hypothetical protein
VEKEKKKEHSLVLVKSSDGDSARVFFLKKRSNFAALMALIYNKKVASSR